MKYIKYIKLVSFACCFNISAQVVVAPTDTIIDPSDETKIQVGEVNLREIQPLDAGADVRATTREITALAEDEVQWIHLGVFFHGNNHQLTIQNGVATVAMDFSVRFNGKVHVTRMDFFDHAAYDYKIYSYPVGPYRGLALRYSRVNTIYGKTVSITYESPRDNRWSYDNANHPYLSKINDITEGDQISANIEQHVGDEVEGKAYGVTLSGSVRLKSPLGDIPMYQSE